MDRPTGNFTIFRPILLRKNNLVAKEQEVAKRMGKSLVKILDSQGADYPVDLKTGKPVKPDLSKI